PWDGRTWTIPGDKAKRKQRHRDKPHPVRIHGGNTGSNDATNAYSPKLPQWSFAARRTSRSSATPSAATSLSMSRLSVAQRIHAGLSGVLVIGRVAAKPQAQLASAPEGSVILSLSLRGVGKLISAPRPKVTPAERQVQLAHPPVQMRTYKPPPQAAEWWSRRCEKNLVVNLDFLATPVIRHRIFQAQPALPRLAHAGFEFHLDLVAVEIEPHFAGETSEGANPSPLHHVINVEP